jgi:Cu(I)/Ag(I) efflux system membrane fusion protein
MSTRRQIGLALLLILAASVVAVAYTRSDGSSVEGGGQEGHNHAAMTGGDELNPVRLTSEAARLIGVTFAEVQFRPVRRTVQTVGRIVYDETRLATVNPKIDGWVERLYVDFTGAPVREGQALMDVYSPKLVSAQEELILARRLADDTAGREGGRASQTAQELLQSSRRRLLYWDIPADEIQRIEETGEVRKALTLRSPASGVVVEKGVVEGDRIMPGMTVYRIADLSTVWVETDVFEKDLSLVRVGQDAHVTLEAYPDRGFHGRVTYVYPTVSMESRTGTIRLELANPDLDLKPGMYAKIRLDVPATTDRLMVPRSAVLDTGERTLVFVRDADGTLMPREVRTGLNAGRDIEILEGLTAGQRVVSSAGFLIDAESRLGSAMSAEDEPSSGMEHAGHSESGQTPEEQHSGHEMPADSTGHEGHEGQGEHEGHGEMEAMDDERSGETKATGRSPHQGHQG